jgi:hypothetical protein
VNGLTIRPVRPKGRVAMFMSIPTDSRFPEYGPVGLGGRERAKPARSRNAFQWELSSVDVPHQRRRRPGPSTIHPSAANPTPSKEPWLVEEQVLQIGGSVVSRGHTDAGVVDTELSGQAQNSLDDVNKGVHAAADRDHPAQRQQHSPRPRPRHSSTSRSAALPRESGSQRQRR